MHSRQRVKDTKAAVVFSSFPQCIQHVENIYQPLVCVPEASFLMRLFSAPQGILLNLDPLLHDWCVTTITSKMKRVTR